MCMNIIMMNDACCRYILIYFQMAKSLREHPHSHSHSFIIIMLQTNFWATYCFSRFFKNSFSS